jgi:hypothetical protein
VLFGGAAVDDILSQGGDREPSPWPRRLAVIAALIVVVGAGAFYLSRPHQAHAPVAAPTASATASAAPIGPSGITGRTLPWATSLRLPITGMQPVWFSPASGDSAPIGGLPDVNSGYQFTRTDGGWAVQANPAGLLECSGCAKPSMPVWFLADGARSVTRVGTATLVAPSATAGAVWLTNYLPGLSMATTAGVAQEVSSTGASLHAPVKLPAGYLIDQATDRGLLLAPVDQQPGTTADKLWNPAAPRASRTFTGVIAASPTEIAWTLPCVSTCRVQVLDLATGRQTSVALPSGSSAAGAAFSPSGQLLALQLSYGLDGALAMRLDVATVATGQLTDVPRTSVSSDALFAFGWPTQGDNLVAEFTFMPTMQLASWHPGASRLAVSVLRPGRTQASLIVG